jgi:membrane carboxypeptidase/penicillin-binding protein
MEKAVQGTPVEVFPVPEGISFVKVDPNTGASLPDGTQGGLYESFLEGTTPEEVPTYGPADEQEGFF